MTDNACLHCGYPPDEPILEPGESLEEDFAPRMHAYLYHQRETDFWNDEGRPPNEAEQQELEARAQDEVDEIVQGIRDNERWPGL